MIRTLPLPLRNRLAETILAALHDEGARRELAALAGRDAGWLGAGQAQWADLLTERARRASEALATLPPLPSGSDLRAALEGAAALFDAGLYFEVHEVLEPHWAASEGETREALQGLIQVAVAYQHLANGNLAGARSLLAEGGARLHGRRLLGTDLDGFARAVGAAGACEPVAAPVPPFPRPG